MSKRLKQLKQDYKMCWEAWKDAKETGDTETMKRMLHELVRIADAMEGEE